MIESSLPAERSCYGDSKHVRMTEEHACVRNVTHTHMKMLRSKFQVTDCAGSLISSTSPSLHRRFTIYPRVSLIVFLMRDVDFQYCIMLIILWHALGF